MGTIQQAFDTAYAERAPVFGSDAAELVIQAADSLQESARILDLGCGDGRNSLFLLEQGFEVEAIDFATSGIDYLRSQAKARGLAGRLKTEVADITGYQPDSNFDAILSITVLENLTRSDQSAVLERIRAGCVPGGIVALESHSVRDPAVNGSDGRSSEFGNTIVGPLRLEDLYDHFAGWTILRSCDIVFEDTSHGEPHDHGRVGILAQNREN